MSPAVLEGPVTADAVSAARPPVEAAGERMRYLVRFDVKTRILHVMVMSSFLGLSATGLPLLFSEAPWAHVLAAVFGGFHGAGLVHRFMGSVLLAAVVWHLSDVCWRAFVRRERGILWGPTSMMPQPRDFVDFYQQMKWFLGFGPRPRIEHFAYWEKFDYWAVLWGTAVMGAAGLVLWFPVAASHVIPGWMFNVALFVHGAEASLAIGFIFVVHFFNGHLRPGKFPMDLVIFTGRISEHELREERAAEYERLRATGRYEQLLNPPPSPALRRRAYTIGSIGLSVGLALVALIVYAALR